MLTIESLGKRIAGRKVSTNGRCGEIFQIDTRYVYVKFSDASAPEQLVLDVLLTGGRFLPLQLETPLSPVEYETVESIVSGKNTGDKQQLRPPKPRILTDAERDEMLSDAISEWTQEEAERALFDERIHDRDF